MNNAVIQLLLSGKRSALAQISSTSQDTDIVQFSASFIGATLGTTIREISGINDTVNFSSTLQSVTLQTLLLPPLNTETETISFSSQLTGIELGGSIGSIS